MNKKYKFSIIFLLLIGFFFVGTKITHAQFSHAGSTSAYTYGATITGATTANLSGGVDVSSSDYYSAVSGFSWGTSSSSLPYSHDVTTVSPGTGVSLTYNITVSCGNHYYYRAYANGSTSHVGSLLDFNYPCNPTVSTAAASSVNMSSAVLNGSVYSGSRTITQVSFTYGSGLSVATTTSFGPGGTNTFSVPLTGLTCGGTAYTVSAFATDSSGTAWASGTGVTFYTSACPTAPTATTTSATVITEGSANLNGSLLTVGSYSSSASEVGFQYGPTTAYGATSTNSGHLYPGSFSQPVSGLMCGTLYHYRVYALNYVYGFGADKTFTTGTCTGSTGNVTGYAWNSNTGWISLDCNHGGVSGASVCGRSSYSVNVTPNPTTQLGLFSGYAWSSGLGWISFNPSDLSSCASGSGAQAKVNLRSGTATSGYVYGWAKVLSMGSTSSGCINLRGTVSGSGAPYGVTFVATSTTNNLAGPTGNTSYAWGGPTIGWISFPNANITFPAPTMSFTVNGGTSTSLTSAGSPGVTLLWTTTNMMNADCVASGDWSGPKSSGGGSELIPIDANPTPTVVTKTFSIGGCTSISGAVVATTTVTVTVAAGGANTPVLIFKANGVEGPAHLNINSGDPVTLRWELTNIPGGSCTGTSTSAAGPITGWNGDSKAPASGVASTTTAVPYEELITPAVTASRVYSITCGSISKTVYIDVSTTVAPTTASYSLNISDDHVPSSGGNVTLQWFTHGLDHSDCTASSSDSSWYGFKTYLGDADTITIPNNSSSSPYTIYYTLSGCTGGGVVLPPQTVSVVVAGGGSTPSFSFLANGATSTHIHSGDPVTLSWEMQNIAAGTCVGTSNGYPSGWPNWTGGHKYPLSTNASIGSTATTSYEIIGASTSDLITTNRTYGLNCGSLGLQSISIIVDPDVTGNLSLTVDTDSFASSGGTRTTYLRWNTNGLDATGCFASGDWSGSVDSSYDGAHSQMITIPTNSTTSPVTKTYTINGCTINGHPISPSSQTVIVTIGAGGSSTDPFLFFTGTNGIVTSSGSESDNSITVLPTDNITLVWQMQNITYGTCRGVGAGSGYTNWSSLPGTLKFPVNSTDGSIGSTPVSHAESVGSISSTHAYTLTCTGTNGHVVYSTVTINVDNTNSSPVLLFNATSGAATGNNINISSGSTVTLAWQVANVVHDSCIGTSSGGFTGWAGGSTGIKTPSSNVGSTLASFSEDVSGVSTSRSYTLTCTGTNGDTVSEVVNIGINGASTPFLSFSASNGADSGSSITVGPSDPVTLSWDVQNITANTCHGTSSPLFGGWNNTIKYPSSTIGTTATSYSEYIGNVSSAYTFTMSCTGATPKSITLNFDSSRHNGCVGGCYRDSSSVNLAVNGEPAVTIAPSVTSALLSWNGVHINSSGCTATSSSADWSGSKSPTGSSTLSYSVSTATSASAKTYTMYGCHSSVDNSLLPPQTATVTITPANTPSLISFTANGVDADSGDAVTINAGSTLTLRWTVQNIGTGSYCNGYSSGSYSGWAGNAKIPTSAMTTAQTYTDFNVGYGGVVTDSGWFTLNCGTAGTKTIAVNVVQPEIPKQPCVGFSCVSTIIPPSLKIFKLPPWLEI